MSAERFGGLRAQIATEAARIMYEEQVAEYFTAKRIAAKRLLGRTQSKRIRYRPQDLPSNGEIRDALLEIATLAEGDKRTRCLFAMRVIALETMRRLTPFHPRLIGSVSTGHIRRGSDIDIQVFCDDAESLEHHLKTLRWAYERELTTIHKFGEFREYEHYHVVDVFPIELTRYETRDLRFRPRSSTDGKPIVRVDCRALETILIQQHAVPWGRYAEDGTVEGLDEWLNEEEEPLPGPFDGLLGTGSGVC